MKIKLGKATVLVTFIVSLLLLATAVTAHEGYHNGGNFISAISKDYLNEGQTKTYHQSSDGRDFKVTLKEIDVGTQKATFVVNGETTYPLYYWYSETGSQYIFSDGSSIKATGVANNNQIGFKLQVPPLPGVNKCTFEGTKIFTAYDAERLNECISEPKTDVCFGRDPNGDGKLDSDDVSYCFANYGSTGNTGVVCTTAYAPVCGSDGKTYSNECYAKAAGASVAYSGECRSTATGGGVGGGGGGGGTAPIPVQPTPTPAPPGYGGGGELGVVFTKLDESFTLQKGQTAILSDYRSMHVELRSVESKFCAAVVGQECPGPVASVEVSVSEPVFRTQSGSAELPATAVQQQTTVTQSSSGSASASGGVVATASRATAAVGGGGVGGGGGGMPIVKPWPVSKVTLQLSDGQSATAFDTTITALDVSSGKATFVVSKKVYVSDVVDVGISPRTVNVEQGSMAKYMVTVQDKHPGIVCKPGQICTQALPGYEYSIEVIGLPFKTSYQNTVAVAAGEKTEIELTVDTSKPIGQPLPPTPILPQPIEAPIGVMGYDLIKYPRPFVEDGKFNAVIVVGSQAPASDVVAAIDIATALQYLAGGGVSPTAKLDTEIADPFAQNIIAVGTPCTNKVTAAWWSTSLSTEMMIIWPPNAEPCNFGSLKENTAMIKLIEHKTKGTVGLIVSGTRAFDTRKAARVLGDYKEWQKKGRLKGAEVLVKGTSFSDITVRPVPGDVIIGPAPTEETDPSAEAAMATTGVALPVAARASAPSADVVRKCLSTGDNYERCIYEQKGKSISATATATIAATAVEPVPRLSTYRFAVRVVGQGDGAVDVAYATLNIQPKEPTGPPSEGRLLPPCGNYGDVDQDSYVSVKDANLVSNYTVGNVQLTGLQKKNAEVTGDGVVDVGDALFIAQYVKMLRSTFPVCGSSGVVTPPPIEIQPVEKVSISLERGWNLVSLPGKVVTFLPSDCTKNRKLLGFIYLQDKDGKGGKYVSLQEAKRQLGSEFSEYMSKHAFWVYSYNGCTFSANVKPYAGYDELSLQPGWNLIPITPAMAGKNLNELNVNCDFSKLYTWSAEQQKWGILTQDYAFTEADLNKGFIAKTDNYCELGGELTISPPKWPE